MTSRHWSTNDVPGRDQRAYWREAVCEAVLNVATEYPEDGGFGGDITCAEYGDLRFAAFTSTPHEIVRRNTHIGRSRGEHFLISLQRKGSSRMSQDGATCELQPGDIGIVDGTRPFTVDFPHPVDRMVAVIPSAMLRGRAPWLERRPLNRLAQGSALHDVLRFYIEQLAGSDRHSIARAGLLTENMCNLVALLTSSSDAERRSAAALARQPSLDVMLALMRRHLANPELSPQLLADQLCVSVRTVHKRFEQLNSTFGRWLLDNRLDACHRALGDESYGEMNVSEIAFGWGFNDLSHFSKAFRRRFRMSPGQYRREQRATKTLA